MGAIKISIEDTKNDFPNIDDTIEKAILSKNSKNKKNYIIPTDGIYAIYEYGEMMGSNNFSLMDVLNSPKKNFETIRMEKFLEHCETSAEIFQKKSNNIFITEIIIFDKNEKQICKLKAPNKLTPTFINGFINTNKKFGETYSGESLFVYDKKNDWLEEKALLKILKKDNTVFCLISDNQKSSTILGEIVGNVIEPKEMFYADNLKTIKKQKNNGFLEIDKSSYQGDYFYASEKEIDLLLGNKNIQQFSLNGLVGTLPKQKPVDQSIDLSQKARVYLDPQKNKTALGLNTTKKPKV